MFRQVGIGAAAVLSIGLLAAGCSEDGDTIVTGGGGSQLPGNTDSSPFAGFQANNLAPDGGGFSENGASVDQVLVKWNCDCPDSDGNSTNADNSALVLFTMFDNGTGNVNTKRALFASHYENGNFTPPVELMGDDRDQTVAIELDSYVLVPMNTASYQTGSTSTATEINTVRDNSGNWLIIGEYTTQFQTPGLDAVGGSKLTANNRGVRRTIASWVFQKNLRNSSLESNNKVGGVTQPFRYGFQQLGTIIPTTFVAGAVNGAAVNGTEAANIDVPACHVTSYGAVTDGFCGETCFDGEALPFLAESTPGIGSNAFSGFRATSLTDPQRTAFTHAIPHLSRTNDNADIFARGNRNNLVQLGTAVYRPGEEVSHIVAVWTQVCSSIAGGGSIGGGEADTSQGGHELQLRYRTFNLATQTWEADEAEVAFAAERNARTSATRAGTAPFPVLRGYNQNLFFKYADASLITSSGNNTGNLPNANQFALYPGTNGNNINDWSQDDTGGHAGGNLKHGNVQGGAAAAQAFWREVIGVVRFKDDGDGTSSVAGTSLDVSSTAETRASVGVHATTTITVNNTTRDVMPSREIANFNCCDDEYKNRSIIGADEGMSDLSLFYVMADNTRTGTGATLNMDRELWVVALNPTGDLATSSFSAGTNPARVSGTHEADYHVSTAPNDGAANSPADGRILQDPVLIRNNGTTRSNNGTAGGLAEATSGTNYNASGAGPCYFELCLNRTGSYAGILFSKDSGNSSRSGTGTGFTQSLYATVYQPFRPIASTTSTTTTTATAANLENRLPSAGPTRVDSDTGFGITQVSLNTADPANDAETSRAWRALPVNYYRWQGFLGYKTGFQSDINIMTIFWEQSDSTEDRVLFRRMTVTAGTGNPLSAPTLALGTAVEIDSTASVQSFAQYRDDTTSRDTFTYLDQTSNLWSFGICDGGANNTGTNGDCLVVYSKASDNTNSDGDGAEQEIRALIATASAGTSQVIDTMVNENNPTIAEGGGTLLRTASANAATRTNRYNITTVDTGTVVHEIVPVPCNTDVTNTANFPQLTTNSFYILIVMGDQEVVISTNSTNAQTITGNGTNRLALYTRKYDGSDNGNNTTLSARLGLPASGSTPQPTQIDHEQGVADDTKGPETCKNGRTIGLVFETNAQLWYQSTTDGTTFNKDSSTGLSNPLLITNQSSQDVTAWAVECCLDSNGDAQGVILWFRKDDTDADNRLFIGAGSVQ